MEAVRVEVSARASRERLVAFVRHLPKVTDAEKAKLQPAEEESEHHHH